MNEKPIFEARAEVLAITQVPYQLKRSENTITLDRIELKTFTPGHAIKALSIPRGQAEAQGIKVGSIIKTTVTLEA